MALNVIPYQHQQPIPKSRKEFKKSDIVSSDKINGSSSRPTPLDFDRFIPWILLEMQSSATVLVTKVDSANNTFKEPIQHTSRSNEIKDESKVTHSKNVNPVGDQNAPIIMTNYDSDGYLTEISIVKRPAAPVHRLVLKAIALCLPFHPMLTKFSIKKGNLDCAVIYEISKLLSFSKLTDICLDHCRVLQGNFYLLLDQQTSLNCLSLSDCKINDLVCKEIAERIEEMRPASRSLRVLNLSSNEITDAGAEHLGRSLRTNRHLVYLNLCNNRITSVGAAHILLPLTRFTFSIDEVLKYKDNRLRYIKKKLEIAEKCLKNLTVNGNDGDVRQKNRDVRSTKSMYLRKRRSTKEGTATDVRGTLTMAAIEDIAYDLAGHINDAFHPHNIFRRGDSWFSVGNFVLCCLNLGYNQLDYFSLVKLVDVLSYQARHKTAAQRGLLRVVIDGNELPVSCPEYDLINAYLRRSVETSLPSLQVKKRGSKEKPRSEIKVSTKM